MKTWLQATGFFRGVLLTSLMPVSLGAALAWRHGFPLRWGLLLATQAAVWLTHAASNMLNDHYDHLSGADVDNPVRTPFSGGTRVIEDGLLTAGQVRRAGYATLGAAAVIFTALTFATGWPLAAVAASGMFLGWAYTAPPLRLAYRGLGEITMGVTHGPLAALAGYYVVAGRIDAPAWWAGAIIGFWPVAIIAINQIPDYEADKRAGKGNLVARFGPEFGLQLSRAAADACFALLALAIFVGALPRELIVGLLLLPRVTRLADRAAAGWRELPKLTASCGATIQTGVIFWALLLAGTIAARLLEGVA
jgi:1,4-dihydroxy-2-naphthoate octaprenyltransferase